MSSFLFEPFFEYLTDETGFSIDQVIFFLPVNSSSSRRYIAGT